jgi:cation diffusion facilitator CzcD-associated flavoprotein CzcO
LNILELREYQMAKTVAIIGAGPAGLAAAAHVLERGMTPIVLEAGPEAGHSVRQWQHVQLFSPWEYNVDKAAARLLAPTGWNSPDPQIYPTGAELLERYIEPLATKTSLRDVIRTSSRVTAVGRAGFDKAKTKGRETAPFEIRYQNGKGPETLRADVVIDASGTWTSPNPAGAGGLTAIGEREAAPRISYGMPDVLGKDRARFAGKTVAVLGAGHSAIGTLTDLTTVKRRAPKWSGCFGATIPPRPSAAASTTSSSPAANSVLTSPRSSLRARSGLKRAFPCRTSRRWALGFG